MPSIEHNRRTNDMKEKPVRFVTLIERHHDEIYYYVWRLLNSADWSDSATEAQDLTQEVFIRAYRAFGRLRQGSNHRAWLYKIATNCVYSGLKRNQHRTQHSVPLNDEVHKTSAGVSESLDHQVVTSETLEAVRQCIAALPPKQGAAVTLRHVQGLSYAEVAQALDCSQDSARANVYQGLRRLRSELSKQFKEEEKWMSD
jgi:RNA polymerase sigma-70 factor (ECF subfamily)